MSTSNTSTPFSPGEFGNRPKPFGFFGKFFFGFRKFFGFFFKPFASFFGAFRKGSFGAG